MKNKNYFFFTFFYANKIWKATFKNGTLPLKSFKNGFSNFCCLFFVGFSADFELKKLEIFSQNEKISTF